MVFEKAPFTIDIEQLRRDFELVRQAHQPLMVSPGYGGWSVTSSTGSYRDGWLKPGGKFEGVSDQTTPAEYVKLSREAGQTRPVRDYVLPTEISTPFLVDLIDSWKELGLNPCRVRFALLRSDWATDWHQDAPDWLYSVRLHIPIITNEGCIFETKSESIRMQADGSAYFASVNSVHRVANRGAMDRVHLIANVFDTKKVSVHHRYSKSMAAVHPSSRLDTSDSER